MRILHLTLKKKYFDMIASGEKKEEYGDGTDYWYTRLMIYDVVSTNNIAPQRRYTEYKSFDVVQFRNGYAKNAPTVTVKLIEITAGEGKPEWGAIPGKEYFIIKLGEIIKKINTTNGKEKQILHSSRYRQKANGVE